MNRLLLQQQTALSTRPALAHRAEQPTAEGRGIDADSAPAKDISADRPATFAQALRRTQKKADARSPAGSEPERDDEAAKVKRDDSQAKPDSADESVVEGTTESEDMESSEDGVDAALKEPTQAPAQAETTPMPEMSSGYPALAVTQVAPTTAAPSGDAGPSEAASVDAEAKSAAEASARSGMESPRATPVGEAQPGSAPRAATPQQARESGTLSTGAAPKPAETPEPGKPASSAAASSEGATKKIANKPEVAESDDRVDREPGTKTAAAAPRAATSTDASPATPSGESTATSAPNAPAATRRQVSSAAKNSPAPGAVKSRVSEHSEADEAETGAQPVQEHADVPGPLFSAERDARTSATAPSATSPEVSSVLPAVTSPSLPANKPIGPDVAGAVASPTQTQAVDRSLPEAMTTAAPSAIHSMPRGLDLFARLSTEPLAAPASAGAQGQANAPEFQRALQAQIQRGVEQAAAQAAASGAWAGGAAVGSGSVMLRLHPANLGLMRVYLRMDSGSGGGGGGVRARFEVSSSRTKGLLGGSIESLRTALRERGLTVDEVTVTEMARMPERELGLPPVTGGIGGDGAAFASGSSADTPAGVAVGVGERAGGARGYVPTELGDDGSSESPWERGGQPVVLAAVSASDSPLGIHADGRVCVDAVV